ncbi:unnamed protein product [Hymenolepis diminuta]|uniref:Uncharacterized protein n=1 Tax=Hymenolepis diminuta TaxID=6216 RepID=A0A564YS68_HYMDI|nr:unnamed protein product [Hymenolepis diminuta]
MIGLTGDEVSEPRTAVLYAFLLAFMIFLEIALNRCFERWLGQTKPILQDHVLKNVLFPLMSMFLDLPIVSGVARRTIANMMAAVKVNATTTPGDKG